MPGRGLTQLPCREGRRGSIRVDGEELVRGQSPGPNVAVNTKGSVYIGKSWASLGRAGKAWGSTQLACLRLWHPLVLSLPCPQAEPQTWPH